MKQMTTKDDGGPAFPHGTPILLADGTYRDGRVGMTLRDWFAGQALSGFVAHPSIKLDEEDVGVELARAAYAFADAMLAERSK
jgi:hypothetical protein